MKKSQIKKKKKIVLYWEIFNDRNKKIINNGYRDIKSLEKTFRFYIIQKL